MSHDPTEPTEASGDDALAPVAPVVLRVVRGNPSPEELAALVAVVAASSSAEPLPAAPRSLWASPARAVRRTPRAGADAWRASGFSS